MGFIHILDENTINQIAAGEVIERPASVVKELIENSVDAGATKISVSVKEGGKALIQVKDNGCGMTKEDALIAFEKHSTSKLRDIKDLFDIHSLGFRGEALASIASVSQTTLVTRVVPDNLRSDSYTGTKLVNEGGELKKVEEVGCPAGTTITVENLFFNVPARLKYMKTKRTELRHIIEIVSSRSLAYPEIFFQLNHEKKRLLFSPSSENKIETLSSILGKTAAREMVELNYSGPRAEVRGFISKPSYTRANSRHIYLFVNRRPVRSMKILKAIREGFGNLLPPVRNPVGTIELFVHPSELDVNIHPTKNRVKFQYSDDVCDSVTKAVKYSLQGKNLTPKAFAKGKSKSQLKDIPLETSKTGIETEKSQKIAGKSVVSEADSQYLSERGLGVSSLKDEIRADSKTRENLHGKKSESGKVSCLESTENLSLKKGKQALIDAEIQEKTLSSLTRKLETKKKFLDTPLPEMRPIGQSNNMFILVETRDGLSIIDQHAAHEKVLYEKFTTKYQDSKVKSQRLIEPFSLELAPEEQEIVSSFKKLLVETGFEIEAFGDNMYIVRTVPVVLGKHSTPETVYDIIDELVTTGKAKTMREKKDSMLKLLACHSAIRAGEELSMPKIVQLLEEMYSLENPFTCPHGRPTIIQLTKTELEKKFKRTGF